jgi:cytochrome P450
MLAGNLDVLDNNQRAMVAHAVIDFQKYFIPRIEQRRQEPTDDLLSGLANATIEDDDISEEINRPRQLTVAEILPIISQILLAGNETTTNLIGNGLVALIERPALMAEIRSDYNLIPDFVEEVLRFESPVQCIYRRANEDVEIDGVKIPAGSMVVPALGAANQDPDVFPRPRELNIHRPNLRRHLAFGIGPHFCVGAEMARLEARVAFETLLGRLDNIRLSEGAELRIHPTFSTRGFKEIPIEFDAIV